MSQLEKLIQHIDPRAVLLETRPLTGGISAQMTLAVLQTGDGEQAKWIIRTPGDKQMFVLMKFLEQTAVSAPKPIYFDDSKQFSDEPLLIMDFVEGEINFTPKDPIAYATQFAEHLAAIHSVSVPDELNTQITQARNFLDEQLNRPTSLDEAFHVETIKSRLGRWQPKVKNSLCLLHGDYWPGNTLWHNEKLVAVIDWEDSYVADPLQDLAKSRSELAWIFGEEVLNHFTQRYQALMPLDYAELPYWDLLAALRFVRLCDGDLDWFDQFFREYGRYDLKPDVVAKRVNQFIQKAL